MEGGTAIMAALTAGIGSLTTIVGNCIELVTSNELLMVLFATTFISAGFGVFGMAKHAARN